MDCNDCKEYGTETNRAQRPTGQWVVDGRVKHTLGNNTGDGGQGEVDKTMACKRYKTNEHACFKLNHTEEK